jgi:hypothetical protein
VVALLAVAAATAGPVYLAAADQSVLEHVVVPAEPHLTGLVVNEQPGQPVTRARFLRALGDLPRSPTGRRFFLRPIYSEVAGASVISSTGSDLAVADVVARSGDCQHLDFVLGRCPTGPGAISMSTRSAAYLHIDLDTFVALSIGGSERTYRVSGLYAAGSASASYWWGSDWFNFGTALTPPPRLDAIFVNPSVFSALAPGQVAMSADVPVNTASLLSSQVPSFRRALSAEQLRLGKFTLLASSGIGGYLAEVGSQQQAMTTTITVIDLQLLLLVLMVLFGIAGRLASGRDQDLVLANLRGISPRAMWAIALREPLVLMVVAAPLGAVLGWLIAFATARAELIAGVPVPFDSLALAAALTASAAAIIATAVGSRRALTQSTERATIGRSRLGTAFALGADAFVVALALAAVVQLSASGVGSVASAQPLAALAPGLMALAAGVIASRAAPFACRLLAATMRFSPKVGLSIGLERVARQSGIARQSVIIAIAVSLACFSVAGLRIDRSNRALEAAFLVGSNRVLTVSVPATVDFVQAVRRADPTGRKAMAVQVETDSGGTLVAVDASRFANVAAWPAQRGGGTPGAVARYLDPRVASDVTLEGATLEMSVDLRVPVYPKPSLTVALYNEQYGASETVTEGPLTVGNHEYVTSLEGGCVSVCRLQSVSAAAAQSTAIPVVIERMAVSDGQGFMTIGAGLSRSGAWRVTQGPPGASSTVEAARRGLLVSFKYLEGDAPPVIAPADLPDPIPAVVTNVVASLSASGPTGSTLYSVMGLDGNPLAVSGGVRVAAIPAVGTNATMIDLTDGLRAETAADYYSVKQVWLSSAAGSGAAIIQRLRQLGVRVTSVRTAGAMDAAFSQDGPTLAFELFVVVGVVSALLAAGSMLFAIAAATRRRAIEAVALRSVGLPRRTLVGAMAVELGIVCGIGLIAGAVAGVAAAKFSLPSVPEFTGLAWSAPLAFGLPVGWLLLTLAGAVVLLAAVVAISLGAVAAASTFDKLRISQQ